MKALRILRPKKLQVSDIAEPVQDGKSVMIQVETVGISQIDTALWKGIKAFGCGHVIGNYCCGIVTDPGTGTDLSIGDRVVVFPDNSCGNCWYCENGMENLCHETETKGRPGITIDGACAEIYAVSQEKAQRFDNSLDPALGTLVVPFAQGHHAVVTKAGVRSGERVLICGGGPVGTIAAWWASKCGAQVSALATNREFCDFLKEHGLADSVANLRDQDFEKELQSLYSAAFDKVFICGEVGERQFERIILPMVRKGGMLIQAGVMERIVCMSFFTFQYKELSYISSWGITKADFNAALKEILRDPGAFSHFIGQKISIREVQKVMTELAAGKEFPTPIVIDMTCNG